MKLIFIYGPPASGKLTIAEKLSDKSGISLFHNHLSRDIVKDIYKDSLKFHYDLVDIIRMDVFDYCAKNNTDLIFTYVYEGVNDDANVKKLTDCIEKNGGEVIFVELQARKEDLLDRVNQESRHKFKKLTDRNKLETLISDLSIFSMPGVDKIIVNTSENTPEESANLILNKINL